MYHDYSQDELRQYCRTNIESLELWARRLIHERMVEKYGTNFVGYQLNDGTFLIKAEVRNHIQSMLANNSSRFKRVVDTLFINQIIYFLCHPILYKEVFKPALDYIFPQGRDEAREYLTRIAVLRNPLSHANPITMHDVERAICYSHDFIEGLKQYYKEKGEEQVWNVPRIIKVRDSLGNVLDNPEDERYGGTNFFIPQVLNCGDKYSIEIEVDPSFTNDEYIVKWKIDSTYIENFDNQKKITVSITEKCVGISFKIDCQVISNKIWHKYSFFDGEVSIMLTVLPPV